MALEDDIYVRVIRELRDLLPDVAKQLEDEVLRGRTVAGSALSRDDRDGRSDNLRRAELQAVGNSDVAAVPYNTDERLTLLYHALLSLAESMYESRRALLHLAADAGIESRRVAFIQPGDDSVEPINLHVEIDEAATALDRARELLQPLVNGVS